MPSWLATILIMPVWLATILLVLFLIVWLFCLTFKLMYPLYLVWYAEWKLKHNKPEEKEAKLMAEKQQREQERKNQLEKINTLEKIHNLSGEEFERVVKYIFEILGYNVMVTKGSSDEGVDLMLTKESKKEIAQCKNWSKPVGSKVAREFYGALLHMKADKGHIVTSSYFSLPCKKFVIGKPIQLIEGHELIEYLKDYFQDEQSN
jgi:HJR/Mrr/RecB family endonuclease